MESKIERELFLRERYTMVTQDIVRLSKTYHDLVPPLMVSVTKSVGVADLLYQWSLGQRHFGENRWQDLEKKDEELQAYLGPDYEQLHWHFLGPIQSNKLKKILKHKRVTHLHGISHEKIYLSCQGFNKYLFLQIKTSEEKEKQGLSEKEWRDICQRHPDALFHGFMTLGSIRTEHFREEAERSFQIMSMIRENWKKPDALLSMGMSEDYDLAMKYGSHILRLGRVLFDPKCHLPQR
jgi:uncharacterized pyridoxal phosphate-containing UPF0001 family protein